MDAVESMIDDIENQLSFGVGKKLNDCQWT